MSRESLTRLVVPFLLVIVIGPLFAATELGGLVVPVVILGVGIALAKHRVMPDRWRVTDKELSAWLDSELDARGGRRSTMAHDPRDPRRRSRRQKDE